MLRIDGIKSTLLSPLVLRTNNANLFFAKITRVTLWPSVLKSHWQDLRHRVLLSQLCHRLTRCIVGTIVTQAYLICIVGTEETDSGNLHATMESLPSRVVLFTIIFITRTLYFADIELAEKQTRSQTFKSWKTETVTSSFWWLQSKNLKHPG